MENQQNQFNQDAPSSINNNNPSPYSPQLNQPAKKKSGFLAGLIISLVSLVLIILAGLIFLGVWLYGQRDNLGSSELSSLSADSQIIGDDAYVEYYFSFKSDKSYYGPKWDVSFDGGSYAREFKLSDSTCRASYASTYNNLLLSNKEAINNGVNQLKTYVNDQSSIKKLDEITVEIQKKDGQKINLQGAVYNYKSSDGVPYRMRYLVKSTRKSTLAVTESCSTKDWAKYQQDIDDIRSKQEVLSF